MVQYVPTHSWKAGTLKQNQTFSIDDVSAAIESLINPKLKDLVETGNYLFIESHFILNAQKYVMQDEWGNTTLTDYARHNMQECALIFDISVRNCNIEHSSVLSCVLNRDKDAPFELDIKFHGGYENSSKENQNEYFAKVVEDNAKMYGELSNDCCDCLNKVLKWRNMTQKSLAEKIPTSPKTSQRIFNWNANISSIGIEHVNTMGDPAWQVAQATIEASARLSADIAKRYGLGNIVVGKNLFSHSDFSFTSCCGPYLKPRLQEICNKANAILNGGTSTPPATSGLYRVRKSWSDVKSQKGAFKDLANTKKIVDTNKGYFVFDENGNKVYPTTSAASAVKTLTVQINGLKIRTKPSLSGVLAGSCDKGMSCTLPKEEPFTIADGWVWARAPKGYCVVGKNTGKAENDDYIFIK